MPSYRCIVQLETVKQIAARLGWSSERLAEARARAAEVRPSNLTDRNHARAVALAESVGRTGQALEEAS